MSLLSRLFVLCLVAGVTLLSIGLFWYVGSAESRRVYEPIRIERTALLGGVLQDALTGFVRAGLPLEDFSGFEHRAAGILEIDSTILSASVVDAKGAIVFCEARGGGDCAPPDLTSAAPRLVRPKVTEVLGVKSVLAEDGTVWLDLPLSDKFGYAGSVVLSVDLAQIDEEIGTYLRPALAIIAAGLVVFLAALAWRSRAGPAALGQAMRPMFFGMLGVVLLAMVGSMFLLYEQGKVGQAEGLARSLAGRLASATELGLKLSDFMGLDQALMAYRGINPDISEIALIRDGAVLLHNDPDQVGHTHIRSFDRLVFELPLPQPEGTEAVLLMVELPIRVVLEALWDGARNFAALFFGCTLLSLTLFGAVRAQVADRGPSAGDTAANQSLDLAKPAYFLAVMADAATWGFLPEVSQELATEMGLGPGWVPLPFPLYFASLTAALIPTAGWTRRHGFRTVAMVGLALVAGGMGLLAWSHDYWSLLAGRAITGFGQGMMLVAIQTYAFALLPVTERAKAASVQVLGYNGGMIAGAAIGGLLAVFNPDADVVAMASALAIAALIYARIAIPAMPASQPQDAKPADSSKADMGAGLTALFGDRGFISALFLVGVSSKFILAGVSLFAVPLILFNAGYEDDHIGQALMLFAMVTFATTSLTPRLTAAGWGSRTLLISGMVLLGSGIAGFGWLTGPSVSEVLAGGWHGVAVACAIIALGAGQGLIAAPVIAHVADTRGAQAVGRDRTLAVYRLVERLGHVAGPIGMAPLLALAAGSASVLIPIGATIAGFAVVFAVVAAGTDRARERSG